MTVLRKRLFGFDGVGLIVGPASDLRPASESRLPSVGSSQRYDISVLDMATEIQLQWWLHMHLIQCLSGIDFDNDVRRVCF